MPGFCFLLLSMNLTWDNDPWGEDGRPNFRSSSLRQVTHADLMAHRAHRAHIPPGLPRVTIGDENHKNLSRRPHETKDLGLVVYAIACGRMKYPDGRMVEMAINIKNEETNRLAHELAALTGSLTTAITVAVQERLNRVQQKKHGPLSDKLLKIGKECAAHLKEPFLTVDHGDLLYDEKGLPK